MKHNNTSYNALEGQPVAKEKQRSRKNDILIDKDHEKPELDRKYNIRTVKNQICSCRDGKNCHPEMKHLNPIRKCVTRLSKTEEKCLLFSNINKNSIPNDNGTNFMRRNSCRNQKELSNQNFKSRRNNTDRFNCWKIILHLLALTAGAR